MPKVTGRKTKKQLEAVCEKERAEIRTQRQNGTKSPRKPATAQKASEATQTAIPAVEPPVAPQDALQRRMDAEFGSVALSQLPAVQDQPEAPPAVKTGARKPTAEQELILAEAKKGHKVFIVGAGAGTGKTTTLRMLAEVLSGNGQYTAFNSSLVKESTDKFSGTKVACNTTHSLAFRAIGRQFAHRLGSARMKSFQVAAILGIGDLEVCVSADPDGSSPVMKKLLRGYLAGQVMGAIRRYCQSDDAEISPDHFRYIDGIDLPGPMGRTFANNQKVREYLLPFAQKAWQDLSSTEGALPFSHDHYVKLWQLNKPIIAGDYVLLDEAQDTAPVMLDIIRQQKIPVILVGDSAQQIYEWRGAVDALASFPDAPRLYLSQSFRFGEAIAAVANAVLETLDNPTELRLKGLPSIPSRIEQVDNPTAILCRTNAVAVASLLDALKDGRRPFLVGGGSDVISFVEAAAALQRKETTSHPDLACFTDWEEVQEYVKLDEGEDLKLMVKLIDSFTCPTILNALKGMPEERNADLVICTAHKSKGREWNSVKLMSDFPTKDKSSDSDKRLLYVAVTRAKLVLDVSSCPFFTGQDSLDISSIASSYREAIPQDNENGVVPPAPSTPPAPIAFTWAKDQETGAWLVRGPSGNEGEYVRVEKRDGSYCTRRLVKQVWSADGIAKYSV